MIVDLTEDIAHQATRVDRLAEIDKLGRRDQQTLLEFIDSLIARRHVEAIRTRRSTG